MGFRGEFVENCSNLNGLSQKTEGLTRSRFLKEETTIHDIKGMNHENEPVPNYHKKIVDVEGHTPQETLLQAGL